MDVSIFFLLFIKNQNAILDLRLYPLIILKIKARYEIIFFQKPFERRSQMKRKEFFKKTAQIGLAAGSMMLLKGKDAQAKSAKKEAKKQEPKSRQQRVKEEWIKALLKHMDEQFDEKIRVKVMEACGRDCARRGAIRMAEASKGDVGKLVDTLARYLGKENCRLEGKTVHLAYSKCLCELVADGPERLSDTYCFCSKGWVLEMFETAAQRPVRVELLQSIRRGAPSCKFLIEL